MFGEVFERFIQNRPVAVMVRVLLESFLNADQLDRWFDTVRQTQALGSNHCKPPLRIRGKGREGLTYCRLGIMQPLASSRSQRLDALHRGTCRLREDRPTARAGVEASGSVVNRLIETVAGGVTGTTDRANQHGQRLHRFSKTHLTTRHQGKSSGSSPVPRWLVTNESDTPER